MQKMLTRILTRQWLVELFFNKILDLAIEEVGVREVAVTVVYINLEYFLNLSYTYSVYTVC